VPEKKAEKRREKVPAQATSPGAPDSYEALVQEQQRNRGILGRATAALQDALQSSRGTHRTPSAVDEMGGDPNVTADDLAIRRAKNVRATRMIVPEGVIIDGNMTSGSETEICGRVDGDVTVEGRLLLGPSALVSGNVRATSCRVEGLVEGKMACSHDLELGQTGRLNGDVIAGRRLVVSGHIFGNVSSGGLLHLVATAQVTGDIRARQIVIEEGAMFNGACQMRPPTQRSE